MTEGERIVREWWPEYRLGHWQAKLAQQIDEAIAKAEVKTALRAEQELS